MKISGGVSGISYTSAIGNRIRSEKMYVWPVYNAGGIDKIHSIKRRTESDLTYTKPIPEDREKLLHISNNHSEMEYTSTGRISWKNPLSFKPGSFFDALA